MKIAILNTHVPSVYGGAEFLADSLLQKLIEFGHEATLLKIPFILRSLPEAVNYLESSRSMGGIESFDLIIPLKFPVYYVNHPNKRVWLLHQFRQVYDLWGNKLGMPNNKKGLRAKDIITQYDNMYLKEAKKIYTISNVISNRLKNFNNIPSEVLYPPLMNPEKYFCEEFRDYLFFPSRLNPLKRQLLAVESMRYTKSNVKLVVAGKPGNTQYLNGIQSIIKKYNLSNKVKIMNHFIPQETKHSLMANSLGCVFPPYNEDYGYVTLEAYYSKKPVITSSDSGGVLEFVENRVNGFITLPEPKKLAECFDELYYNKLLARRMGRVGYEKISTMNISWDNVIQKLIG